LIQTAHIAIQSKAISIINKSKSPFFTVIKMFAYMLLFCICALTTMISMLTMADGGDSKVKIVQPSPTV